ncbi:MAG: 3-oxoacyl-[acyl-carrier-protein] reductase [Phycisphaerales bacterium]|nr:3-oxoacyl-[acyl-carrier-protein] reductase [Phycisphaerales bacterium]
MKLLENKVSLVTGGSRGIGRSICLALASEGSHVAVNYASHDAQANEVCAMLRDKGVKAFAYRANIANDDENHRMVEQIHKDLGPVSILVNNAGITRDRTFVKMTYEMWKEVLDVDLTGPAMVTHEVLKDMIDNGWGRVVFMTSIVGQTGNFGQSNYAVAKGGLIALTRTLAREVARKGITVNAVAPGFIETDMTAEVPPQVLDKVREATPVGRLGKPDEIADAVRFLCSPGAAYITGEVINVNGGMYMG